MSTHSVPRNPTGTRPRMPKIQHDYDDGATIGSACNFSAYFVRVSRNAFVNPASCKMFISVLWAGMLSFLHDSFHQQKPITAGQRPENKSSRAFFAQPAASTFRW